MPSRSSATTIDEYIAEFPPGVQAVLEEMRSLIREVAPDATETISYAIPTFDLGGKHLVHFAGYERHVGLYPAPTGMAAFADDFAPYKTGKGSVQFPLGQPLPIGLIRRVVEFRAAEIGTTRKKR
ncbi:MAG: hypothetical protein EG823_07265 [Actinobacteria bacterium]|nr:hypothetical protein [Actinomycetota bacterium]